MSRQPSHIQIPVGYAELVRGNANFRSLWFGQIVSLFGDWFNLIASAALVNQLTRSGLAIGGLFVARMLAQFIGSPIGGLLADRINRKALLILTDLARGVTVLGFLFVREPRDVWLLYTLTVVQMIFSGIFVPTRNAILPDLTSDAEIGAANALSSVTWSTMLAFGSALGGIVAGEWGLRPSFVIDSATFFFSAFFISRIQYQKTIEPEGEPSSFLGFFKQYGEGLGYLRQNRPVLLVALQKAAISLSITSVFQIVQVTIAGEYFVIGEGGSTSLGLIYAAVGIGTGFGPVLARWLTKDDSVLLRWSTVLGYLMAAVGVLVVSSLSSFPVILFGTVLRGMGASITWVMSTQLLFQVVPNRIRGRVFSAEFAVMTLFNASGTWLGGWALDALPVTITQVLWVMAGMGVFFSIFWTALGMLRQEKPGTESVKA